MAKQIKQTFSASKHGRSRQSAAIEEIPARADYQLRTDSGLLSFSWAMIGLTFVRLFSHDYIFPEN